MTPLDHFLLTVSNARDPLAFRKLMGETLTPVDRARLWALDRLLSPYYWWVDRGLRRQSRETRRVIRQVQAFIKKHSLK